MRVEFLLGPAGSGKTFECLRQAREALARSPEGPALLFIAPKQATYQLERQLLSSVVISGFTRLRILSFERLAKLVFSMASKPEPKLLENDGRVMVLRGLLSKHEKQLQVFHTSARFHGFAQELSRLLGLFHQSGWSPAMLQNLGAKGRLREKASDLALLFSAYEDWLERERLQDADGLLQLAANVMTGADGIRFESIWVDGFARFTAPERRFIKALIQRSGRMTLAFCLDHERTSEPWHSHWSAVSETARDLKNELSTTKGIQIRTRTLGNSGQLELLPSPAATAAEGRFRSPELRHLELNWAAPRPYPATDLQAVRLVECATQEAEATFAAREILRYVRRGGRFRETAVLVRTLDQYHEIFRRVFRKYDIPFFIDRREPIAHHPLAELTRGALKTIAFNWRREDWFAALKTGLMPVANGEIDQLENEALAHGWDGDIWQHPIAVRNKPGLEASTERCRRNVVPPFARLGLALGPTPTGAILRNALRTFWADLRVERTLEQWSRESDESRGMHESVWDQMQHWIDTIALAFRAEPQPLADWIPIVEAGLESLTIGVIPPVLDQVLLGGVDRSRNPDLECVFVLGLNEGVFPARPGTPVILTEAECESLRHSGSALDLNLREKSGLERYLGYIACTRASTQLIATYALRDQNGNALNRSSHATHLQRLFPQLREAEKFNPGGQWIEAEHFSELIAPLLKLERQAAFDLETDRPTRPMRLSSLREFAPLRHAMERVTQVDPSAPSLSAELAEKLYGAIHRTSVSALEKFGQCPFRFFIDSGLRAKERLRFALDARQQGTFQHQVLEQFHERLRKLGKSWHAISPPEARDELGRIADEIIPQFAEGMLIATEENRFVALESKERLQRFIELLVEWMGQYRFEPARAEWSFGFGDAALPPWRLDLGKGRALELRGKIDRIDVYRPEGAVEALCVIMDYKAGPRKIDRLLLDHGIEMQLPAYLAATRRLEEVARTLGMSQLRPVGGFFINLRGRYETAENRETALSNPKQSHKEAFQHLGLFDVSALDALDNRNARQGDQFRYTRKRDGTVSVTETGPMAREDFEAVLDGTEARIRHFGRELLEGRVDVAPYKTGTITPCQWCEHGAICRIDPWQHTYRKLGAEEHE